MEYFIAVDKTPTGPFELNDLVNHNITPETLLWCEGMEGWKPASEIEEVSELLFKNIEQEEETTTIPPIPADITTQVPPIAVTEETPTEVMVNDSEEGLPNYLSKAILCTIFCFTPLGIAAIVMASIANTKWNNGDKETAISKASLTQKFIKISFWVGIGIWAFAITYYTLLLIIVSI